MGYDSGTNVDIIIDNMGYFKIYDSGQKKILIKFETIVNLAYFYIVGGQKPNTKFN